MLRVPNESSRANAFIDYRSSPFSLIPQSRPCRRRSTGRNRIASRRLLPLHPCRISDTIQGSEYGTQVDLPQDICASTTHQRASTLLSDDLPKGVESGFVLLHPAGSASDSHHHPSPNSVQWIATICQQSIMRREC
jgi:hypothetical protein